MNKRTVRSFSLGMLFATVILLVFFLLVGENPEDNLEHGQDAKEEIERLSEIITVLEDENRKLQETILTLEEQKDASHPEPVLVEIHKGMTNDEVVEILGEKNLISNEDIFKQFMVDHGYDRKIQPGTYILYPDMTPETLAKIITNNQ